MSSHLKLLLLLLLFFFNLITSSSSLTITSFSISNSPWRPTQNLTILSPNSTFAAGFRPAGTNPNLYIFSVWFHNISTLTPVWSANLNSPVNSSAALLITSSGHLILNNTSGQNLWPETNISSTSNTSKLTLFDNGNLVYANWESFQSPSNTILPNQTINSAKLVSNNGNFTFVNSTELYFNSTFAYWDTYTRQLQTLNGDGRLSLANGEIIFSSDYGPTRLRRLVLEDDGNIRIYSFDPTLQRWVTVWQAVLQLCLIKGTCGPNAICVDNDFSSTNCVCPPGFKPRSGGSKQGCDRKVPLATDRMTKFVPLDYVNFTGGSNQTVQNVLNFTACQALCLAKPNCLGFLFKFTGSKYCVLQLDRMLFGYWQPGSDMTMFVRVDQSELDTWNFTGMTNLLETTCPVRIRLPTPPDDSNSNTRNIVIICTIFGAELISGVIFFWAFLKKFVKYRDMAHKLRVESMPVGGPKRFTYAELKVATNDFSDQIGRGGFGDVYKGELPDKRVVAVKCLKYVTGGDAEFWPEVTIISRMHHLNLVRLWGFCAEKDQRMLVYEYVTNGSLDKFLFTTGRVESINSGMDVDSGGSSLILDWGVRYRIALGVARAIAYLHEECLEWVLHCDIKPENILIGDDFCPKLSDFGLAKLRKKEDIISMSRMRGTRGYMAPEWIKADSITPKADVFSFGMVLLEIVAGVRNFEMQGSMAESADWYFPRWAFDKVFKEMNVDDILDRRIKQSYDNRKHFDMVNRMVQTAMWCLQDKPEMRPSMGKVAKMLEGTVEIIQPQKPTIFFLADD